MLHLPLTQRAESFENEQEACAWCNPSGNTPISVVPHPTEGRKDYTHM